MKKLIYIIQNRNGQRKAPEPAIHFSLRVNRRVAYKKGRLTGEVRKQAVR
jgi:hypothetical protein